LRVGECEGASLLLKEQIDVWCGPGCERMVCEGSGWLRFNIMSAFVLIGRCRRENEDEERASRDNG
jgi:hypothetical protein